MAKALAEAALMVYHILFCSGVSRVVLVSGVATVGVEIAMVTV